MTVTLTPVERDDLRPLFNIKVSENQTSYVAANEYSLAQAPYETGATPMVIRSDNTRVGFMMVIDMRKHKYREPHHEPDVIYLWRLMIGCEFQGMGYGKAAMLALFDYTKRQGLSVIESSVVQENAGALKFYESLGFELTGEIEDEELCIRKHLTP